MRNWWESLDEPAMRAGWKPIETAPKDGQRILLGWMATAVHTGKWNAVGKRWRIDAEYAPEYMPEYLLIPEEPPTHWQPLAPPPAPPTAAELAAEKAARAEDAYYRVLAGV